MGREILIPSFISVILFAALCTSIDCSAINILYSQASPITAETPKVILQQGTAGKSAIYINSTSARVTVNTTKWLSGWSYRKSHVINGASGAGTNYQIKIIAHYGSGTDSGEDVYLNGHCRADFGDVRFTDDDCVTLLDYWMESYTAGDNALFWVKVADNLSPVPKVEGGNWNVDGRTYHFRTKITVTENSGSNLTDYQVKVDINTEWLVDKGYATSIGNETRFTDSDGSTLLNFWRQTAFNQPATTYWVKIPSLTANTSKTIYFYYDARNTDAPDASNANATFDFFSDGSSLDGWVNNGAIVDSAVGCPAPSLKASGGKYAYKNVGLDPNRVLEFDGYIIPGTTPLCNLYFLVDSSGAGQMFRLEGRSAYSSGFASTTSWTSWSAPSGYGAVSIGVFHKVKIVIKATTAYGYIDDAFLGQYTFANNGGYIAIHGDAGIVTGGEYDNIRVRKYVEPEPSVNVEQETAATTIYIYYGKSDATTTSNATNTFIVGELFTNTAHWTPLSGTWSLVAGEGNFPPAYKGVHDGSSGYRKSSLSNYSPPANFRLLTRVKSSVDNSLANIVFRAATSGNDDNNRIWVRLDQRAIDTTNHYGGFHCFEDIGGSEYVRGYYDFNPIVNQWYHFEILAYGSSIKGYLDGVLRWTATVSRTAAGYLLVQVEYLSGHDAYFDYICIGKYVDPEPGHGAWGSEETRQTFDYILKIANQASDNWNIRLIAYDQTNIGRLSNCTIYFYNGGGVSRQISIHSGTCVQQFGNWYDLAGSSIVYIAMTVSADGSGASYVYSYLEVLIPNTTTYNLMIITFEIS